MSVHKEPLTEQSDPDDGTANTTEQPDFFDEGFFRRLEDFLTGEGTWAQVVGWDAATVYRYAQLGHDLMQSAQWDAARVVFEGCQALNPLDWHFPYCLAVTHRAQNQSRRALDCLDLASSLAPERPEPHFMKAFCLLQVDNKQEATTALVRAHTLCGPESPAQNGQMASVARQLLVRLKRETRPSDVQVSNL
jgi:tetratricopeptide (TPR) repeat protein